MSATRPGPDMAMWMLEAAIESQQVASQMRSRPWAHVVIVIPSGRLPSTRDSPWGYIYIYSFAVARWLLCLLSDYKSATCSERGQFVIRQRLYLIGERLHPIGEQEYLIGFKKISNRVQCDSINSNNTSHASSCIQIKTQEQFNEAYSNSTLLNH